MVAFFIFVGSAVFVSDSSIFFFQKFCLKGGSKAFQLEYMQTALLT